MPNNLNKGRRWTTFLIHYANSRNSISTPSRKPFINSDSTDRFIRFVWSPFKIHPFEAEAQEFHYKEKVGGQLKWFLLSLGKSLKNLDALISCFLLSLQDTGGRLIIYKDGWEAKFALRIWDFASFQQNSFIDPLLHNLTTISGPFNPVEEYFQRGRWKKECCPDCKMEITFPIILYSQFTRVTEPLKAFLPL